MVQVFGRVQASRGRGGGLRSVASRAANVSLSTRSARASGARRHTLDQPCRPGDEPACGPPSNLSPLAVTRPAPARSARREVGLVGKQGIGTQQAAAHVDDHRHPEPGELADRNDEVNPLTRKFDGCTFRMQPVSRADGVGVIGQEVRLVVPISRSGAPVDEQVGQPETVADLDQLAPADG